MFTVSASGDSCQTGKVVQALLLLLGAEESENESSAPLPEQVTKRNVICVMRIYIVCLHGWQ